MSFYDRKEVRDILAYFKVLANPCDEVSLLRIINTPARGIGKSAVKRLLELAIERRKPLWEVLPEAATPAVAEFCDMIGQFQRRMEKGPLPAAVRELIAKIAYRGELARLYPDANEQQSRWQSIEEVVNAVASYAQRAKQPTLAGFLQDVALAGAEQDKESQLERDAVALMTLHAAKGLEFPEVYMVGMEEGMLPHARSIAGDAAAVDEERRLCYVGVTCAAWRLTLTLVRVRLKWGKPRPTIPSRFLYELTGQADNPNYLAAQQQQPRSPAAGGKRPPASKPPRAASPPRRRRSRRAERRKSVAGAPDRIALKQGVDSWNIPKCR